MNACKLIICVTYNYIFYVYNILIYKYILMLALCLNYAVFTTLTCLCVHSVR